MIYQAQSLIVQLLGLAALLMQIFALVDAARYREDAFRAAGKMTKTRWLVILGLAVLIGFVFVRNPFGLVSLIAIVAAGVYLADVRPALRQVMGQGGSSGPYGRW